MRISELLEAIKNHKSNLPSAPSINDEPLDSDDELDGEEDDGEDSPEIVEFKNKAQDLGKDLYILSMYDYSRDFSNVGPNGPISGMLGKIDDPVVNAYLNQDNIDIVNNKLVSVLIYNDRNGEFIQYNAGEGAGAFEDVEVESDQAATLEKIQDAGLDYSDEVGKVSWKAGESPPSKVYDVLGTLMRVLDLPNLPKGRDDYYDDISPEKHAFNKKIADRRNSPEGKERRQKILAQLKAEQEAMAKNGGAGRETR